MAETNDMDRPLPKAPQPDNYPSTRPPRRFTDEEIYGGTTRRYSPACWAGQVFGPKKKRGRK